MRQQQQLISGYVGGKIERLQRGYVERAPHALAGLAALRQAGFSTPGNSPRTWGLLYEGLPEELAARGGEPSRVENAVQGAMVLFANHQTSRSDPMHRPGQRVGAAVGALARARSKDGDLDSSVLARFQVAALSQTHSARVRLLQQLVSMMRAERAPSIGLDYGRLAVDLYLLQFPSLAPRVRLDWGRNVHRIVAEPTSAEPTPTTEEN